MQNILYLSIKPATIYNMEKEPNILGSLFEKATDYIETNAELLKLKAVDKTADVVASIVSALVMLVFSLIVIVLLNIGVALWIGDLLGKAYYGFFIVAGFYIIVGLIFHFSRRKLLKEPLTDLIIKKFLN
jgi:hypothetical protein